MSAGGIGTSSEQLCLDCHFRSTEEFGKQKATLKCMLKYVANRPPAAPGGSMTLEEVEYNGSSYRRTGGAVVFKIQFNSNGKL